MRYAAALAAAPLALVGTHPAVAQTPASAAEEIADGEDIVVTGMGATGYRLTADQLRDAIRAFGQHAGEFAPQAALRWRVLPAAEAEGLTVRLVSGDERIEIPLDADGSFTLPADRILSGQWRLQTNAGRRQIRIRPQTYSPGSSDGDLRVGDARLLCRVYWAFANNRFSLFQRAIFGVAGGCSSRRIGIWYSSDRAIARASVGATELPVRPDGMAFRPPLADRDVTHEERIVLTFQ